MQEIVKYHNDLNKVRIPNFNELQQNIFFGLIARLKGNSDEVLFTAQELNEFVKDKKYTNKELFLEVNKLKDNLLKADFTSILKNKNSLDIGYHNIFKSFYMRVNTIDTSEIPYDKIDKVYELPNGAIFHSFEHLRVVVNPEFAEIVNALSNFTRFELAEFIALSGKYTKTLYRQLKQFRQTGNRLFAWDEFLEIMDIPNDYRQIDIDARILKPAIKELTAEQNLFDFRKRIPFENLKYTKLDKNKQPNPRGRNKVCFIKFEWKKEKVQEELEAEAMERIAENMKNHIPTSADYNAKQEFENYKGVEVSFYDSNNRLRIAEIKDFDNETNQLLCYDKKVNQNFYIPFENLQKANTWIAEKLQGIY